MGFFRKQLWEAESRAILTSVAGFSPSSPVQRCWGNEDRLIAAQTSFPSYPESCRRVVSGLRICTKWKIRIFTERKMYSGTSLPKLLLPCAITSTERLPKLQTTLQLRLYSCHKLSTSNQTKTIDFSQVSKTLKLMTCYWTDFQAFLLRINFLLPKKKH